MLFLLIVSGCQKEREAGGTPVEVRVASARAADVPVSREWVGQTLGAVDIEIRARVNGWLEGIHFKEGTEVRKGRVLYTIDSTELEQSVAEARARLAGATTLLANAESSVNRYRPLFATGAASKRDLDDAVALYEARKSEVEAAQASMRLAETNLGYAVITAPIDGLIGISAARVGDFVGRPPNPVILNTISRIDSIHVRFSITEQEYMDLVRKRAAEPDAPKPSYELEMTFADGTVYPEKGSVIFAQRQIDAATGTLQMEASFPNPKRLVRPGQFARIRTITEERKNAVVVPSRAIIELQGQAMLYCVIEGNKVAMRRVVTGPRMGTLTVIEEGLTVGDRVVVEGMQKIRPDAVVTPVELPPDSAASALPR